MNAYLDHTKVRGDQTIDKTMFHSLRQAWYQLLDTRRDERSGWPEAENLNHEPGIGSRATTILKHKSIYYILPTVEQ